MKSPHSPRESAPLGSAEETLQWIAGLPAPQGLEDRVQTRLRTAPQASRRMLWPAPLAPAGGWRHATALRGVAAAAIVCVVAGGGWQVYSRVQTVDGTAAHPLPPRFGVNRGFSTADAKHVPNTIHGPVLTHALVPAPAAPASVPGHQTARPKNKVRNHPATPPALVPVK